jgi:heat shock protein HslJ
MKLIIWISALLALSACSSPTDSDLPSFFQGSTDPGHLQGTIWTLTEAVPVTGFPDSADVRVTLRFFPDRVGGYAGPNSYGGEYSATSHGTLRMSELVMTLIGGSEAEEAASYLGRIADVRSFRVTSDELLLDLGEHGIYKFRRDHPQLL